MSTRSTECGGPPALVGARDLYALYFEGDSMEPEHRPGDLCFVHPGSPPRVGDTVVIQIRSNDVGPVSAMIGHLRQRGSTRVLVGKLNPDTIMEIAPRTIIAIHKVLTQNEMCGV